MIPASPRDATHTRWGARAFGVVAIWGLGALPVLSGRCAIAAVLHAPCPGCGMTRALQALLGGDARESLQWHPLAVPVLGVQIALAAVSVALTYRDGSPFEWLYSARSANGAPSTRLVRTVLAANVIVFALTLALWGVRALGYAGGLPSIAD